uniref:SUN domain-containing protein 1-like n=1 Tax=Myxine glutinosa TaxID=7769 RepID=UPI00358E5AEB
MIFFYLPVSGRTSSLISPVEAALEHRTRRCSSPQQSWTIVCLLILMSLVFTVSTTYVAAHLRLKSHHETSLVHVQFQNNLMADIEVIDWTYNFAAESNGGRILDHENMKSYIYLLSFVVPYSNPPQNIIRPDVCLNSCWAAEGRSGEVTIKLSRRVKIMAFTIEHLPVSASPTGSIISAPKHFAVYGFESGQPRNTTSLGIHKYLMHGEPVQRFKVQVVPKSPFNIIKVKLLNNWGQLDYTTLYSFKVHGARHRSCMRDG